MDAYSLGQLLQQARDSRELSLEDVKAKTRIPTHILESFEQGLFQLPELSPVQARGLLTNYASFLNLDVEQVQAAYADILNPPKRRRRQPPPQPRPPTESRRPNTEARRSALMPESATPPDPRRTSGEYRRAESDSNRPQTYANRPRKSRRSGGNLLNILVIFTLALASIAVIVVIIAQLVRQMTENSTNDPLLNTTPGLADLPPTSTFTPAPTRIYVRTPTLLPRSTQNYQGEPVLVTISFQQRAWVRVTADGAELYSGLVRPYELTLEYRGINDVVVTSSNAEALIVTYNGQPQPSYGGRGQEVIITFRPNNNITIQGNAGFNPTSEFTTTPQDTPISVAATLLAEQTPSPTDGPSPTPTNTPRPSDTAEFTPTTTSTPTATATITPSFTPSITPTATQTLPPTATPSPTAVVPPRLTPVESTPEKP